MQKRSDKDPKQDVLAMHKLGTSCQRNTGMYFATATNTNKEIYQAFAGIYDATMKNVPYLQWASFIFHTFSHYQISSGDKILDAGCGTGSLMKLLQTAYPHIYGLDVSTQMLAKAVQKKCRFLVNGDICSSPFRQGEFKAILCTHDVVNYICDTASLKLAFQEFRRLIQHNGILLFDISTAHNAVQNYHNRDFHEKHAGTKFDWYNTYNETDSLLVSRLEFRSRAQGMKKEIHTQKMYEVSEILDVLDSAGFENKGIFSDYSNDKNLGNAQLITFVTQAK